MATSLVGGNFGISNMLLTVSLYRVSDFLVAIGDKQSSIGAAKFHESRRRSGKIVFLNSVTALRQSSFYPVTPNSLLWEISQLSGRAELSDKTF